MTPIPLTTGKAATMTGEATFWRMEAERHMPAPDRDDPWTALREYIRTERTTQDHLAAEHAEYGRDWSASLAYGAVRILDRLLTAMDRIEAAEPVPPHPEEETPDA